MSKLFTKLLVTDTWGKQITVYRTWDGKVSVELQYPLTGGYWWTKIKHVYSPGDDGALNLTDEQNVAVASIIIAINKENLKLRKQNGV